MVYRGYCPPEVDSVHGAVTGTILKKGIVMMMENAWIIPLFPLLSFLILLLFGKRLKEASAYVGILLTLASLVYSLLVLFERFSANHV